MVQRKYGWLTGVAGGLLVAAIHSTAGAQAPAGATYVGSETCKGCHAELGEQIAKTVHGQVKDFELTIKDKKGCEGCHGAGSLHAEAGGDKTKIAQIKEMTAAETSKVCLSCHKVEAGMDWAGSSHAMSGMSCGSCHDPHKGKAHLLKQKPNELCASCHAKQGAQGKLTSHHPLAEGKMTCVSCHNPHSAANNNLKGRNVNEVCDKCHLEKKGPFTFEHPPVAENCALCHDPHGTVNRTLLKVSQPFLCMNCHRGMVNHVSVADINASGYKIDNQQRWTRCTLCHVQIHGTNIPSMNGHGFTR